MNCAAISGPFPDFMVAVLRYGQPIVRHPVVHLILDPLRERKKSL
jgi:hypothetical protein